MPAEPTTLDALLRSLADQHGDRLAAASESAALTFGELDENAGAWAARLRQLGAGRGKHVGLLAGNGPEWLAAAFGIWRSGATLVPISTFVTPRELRGILAHADVEVLIAQARLRGHDYTSMLAAEDERPPRLRHVVDLAAPLVPASRGDVVNESSDIAGILYTSGTTGEPKGVMLSHRALLSTVLPTAERTGLGPDDALLSTLPLFWVAGLAIRALPTLATGCALLLVESFTPEAAIAMLRRHHVTGIHLRPPQVGQILGHADFRPGMLAAVHRGGGRTEWFAPHFEAERVRFITGYGMTETSGYVTALDWRDSIEARRSELGAPLPGVEIRTVAGEVRVRCPGLFSGYYKQPAGTGLDEEGFFRTGDLGRFDEAGGFHFDGRSKDLLRVKGINVSPVEVEGVLAQHPGVETAYVVGLPHEGQEQTVVALIVPRGEVRPEAELREIAREQLSHYKRPEHYLFIARSDVVLGGTSKPQRAALADLASKRL